MTMDNELEIWRKEWRSQTEALPALKRKIKHQNLRTAAAIVAIVVCLALSIIVFLHTGSSFLAGVAAGIGFSSAVLGSYTLWARRGTWKPTAQTTMAYTELLHKRAWARIRILNFCYYFVLIAALTWSAFIAWHWRSIRIRDVAIATAFLAEMIWLKRRYQIKQHEIQETRRLLDDLKR